LRGISTLDEDSVEQMEGLYIINYKKDFKVAWSQKTIVFEKMHVDTSAFQEEEISELDNNVRFEDDDEVNEEDLIKAYKSNPRDVDAIADLSTFYFYDRQDYSKALIYIDKEISMKPKGDHICLYQKAICLKNLNKLDEALTVLDSSIKLHKDNDTNAFTLDEKYRVKSEIEFDLGKHKDALKSIDYCIKNGSDYKKTESKFTKAKYLINLKMYIEAKEILDFLFKSDVFSRKEVTKLLKEIDKSSSGKSDPKDKKNEVDSKKTVIKKAVSNKNVAGKNKTKPPKTEKVIKDPLFEEFSKNVLFSKDKKIAELTTFIYKELAPYHDSVKFSSAAINFFTYKNSDKKYTHYLSVGNKLPVKLNFRVFGGDKITNRLKAFKQINPGAKIESDGQQIIIPIECKKDFTKISKLLF